MSPDRSASLAGSTPAFGDGAGGVRASIEGGDRVAGCTAREAAFRRECVDEAVASVRAEGLEISAACLDLLEAIATGHMDEEQAIDRLRRHYDCA